MERILLESALRAVLLALCIGAIVRLAKVRSAGANHAAWSLLLAAMLVLPFWALWGPRASLPLITPQWVHRDVPVARVTPPTDLIRGISEHSPQLATDQASAVGTLRWQTMAMAVYSVGVLVLLTRLFVGTVRAQQLIRAAARRGEHLTSSLLSAPVTVGWLRPVVVLPEDWHTWATAQLDAILAHEREHVRRRDPIVQWFALLNRAVFWFHPLAWWLERRLASLAEDACDAAVLSRGHRPAAYCEYLLSIAHAVTGAGARVTVVGAPMPGASLPHRIQRILQAGLQPAASPVRLAVTLLACVGAAAAVTSGTFAAESPKAARASDSPIAGPTAPVTRPRPSLQAAAIASTTESAPVAESQAQLRDDPPSGLLNRDQVQDVIVGVAEAPRAAALAPPQAVAASELALLSVASARRDVNATAAHLAAADPAREREFDDILRSGRHESGLSLTAAFSYVQLNMAEYAVPVTIRIAPDQALTVGRGERSQIDFAGLVTDAYGVPWVRLRDEAVLSLEPGQVAAVATTPLVYSTSFVLLPGRYTLKVVGRDRTTGLAGTTDLSFTIPNLSRQRP